VEERLSGWDWARTADEAIALLKTGKVEEASLDHDLTDQQRVHGGMYGEVYDDGHSTGYTSSAGSRRILNSGRPRACACIR
jgi:hypothetical protein